ncbi:hypothetical protein V8C37DRAFT_279330 [Trichoderma ceciliae]
MLMEVVGMRFAEPGSPCPLPVCLSASVWCGEGGGSINRNQSISTRPHGCTHARPASCCSSMRMPSTAIHVPSRHLLQYIRQYTDTETDTRHRHQTQTPDTDQTPGAYTAHVPSSAYQGTPYVDAGLLPAACTKAIDYMYSVEPTVSPNPFSSRSTLTRRPRLLCMSVAGHTSWDRRRRGAGGVAFAGSVVGPGGPPLVEFDNEQLHNTKQ